MTYPIYILIGLVTCTNVAASAITWQSSYGHMPDRWAERAYVREGTRDTTLADMVGCAQLQDMRERTSTQCHETFQYLAGSTTLALNGIVNTQVAGGRHGQIRILAPALHVTGPAVVDDVWFYPAIGTIDPGSQARVARVHGLGFKAVAGADETWGLDFEDLAVKHRIAGTLQVGSLAFTNGWKLEVDGDSLVIRDARGVVRLLR